MIMLPRVFAHAEHLNRVGCVHRLMKLSLFAETSSGARIRIFFLEQIIYVSLFSTKCMIRANAPLEISN
jgi:hypothetical protein